MKYTEEILKIAKFIGIDPIRGFNEHSGNTYYYYNDVILDLMAFYINEIFFIEKYMMYTILGISENLV